MTNPIIKIHDVNTNEVIEREMNDAELSAYENASAIFATREAEIAAKAATKQAVLEKLGITEDEANAILSA